LALLRRHAFLPDDRCGWIPFAVREGIRVVRQYPSIKVIVSSNYPQSAHVAAGLIARATGRRWVADFRDGWTQNPAFYDPGNGVMAWAQHALERWTARNADAVVTVSPPITRHLQSLRGERRRPVVTIPNGFDDELLVAVDAPRGEPLRPGKFTILYTGTLFGRRTAGPFFDALAGLLAQDPSWRERLGVVFRTEPTAELDALRDLHRLGGVVEFLPPIAFREIVADQRRADALLLLLEEGPGAEIMVSQKVFEYLAARRPIVAMIPPGGAAAEILRETGGALVLPTSEPALAAESLAHFLASPQSVPPAQDLNLFRRSVQAAAMAKVLRNACR
jgi:glycosyltransferase involved in cell wall biosynthesis